MKNCPTCGRPEPVRRKRPTVAFRVNEDMKAALEEKAAQEGIPAGEIMENALAEALGVDGEPVPSAEVRAVRKAVVSLLPRIAKAVWEEVEAWRKAGGR